jgi:hypothetical protein
MAFVLSCYIVPPLNERGGQEGFPWCNDRTLPPCKTFFKTITSGAPKEPTPTLSFQKGGGLSHFLQNEG